MAVLGLPVTFYAARGEPLKVSFFLNFAIYVGTMKWVGWFLVSREYPQLGPRRVAMFALEIFSGLAILCGWVYVRNLLALLWPAGYSLRELYVLPYLVIVLQVAGVIQRLMETDRVRLKQSLLERIPWLLGLLAYPAVLGVALRRVSGALYVHSTDPFLHGCHAMICRDLGLGYAGFNGGGPAVYTSGFAVVNATAASISPLSFVQTVNGQHIFLIITAMFLVVGLIQMLLNRPLWLLPFVTLVFLSVLPVHNLDPKTHYEGAGRQAACGVFLALCMVPVYGWLLRGRLTWRTHLVTAMLGFLMATVNPTAAVMGILALAAAFVVLALRARESGLCVWRVIAMQLLCCALTVPFLRCDVFVWHTLCPPKEGRPHPTGEFPEVKPFSFSWSGAFADLSLAKPWRFTRDPELAETYIMTPADPLQRRFIPAVLLGAGILAAAGWYLRRSQVGEGAALLKVCAVPLALWLPATYLTWFVHGGCAPIAWDMVQLHFDVIFVLFRVQMLIVFAVLCVVLALGCVLLERAAGALGRAALVVLFLAAFGVWVWPARQSVLRPTNSGLTVLSETFNGLVTPDDLELVRWADENIPPENGVIGLASSTFAHHILWYVEHHLYPYGGSHALPLYGKRLNYCFSTWDPSRNFGYDDYNKHVKTVFDPQWCLENSIRYFYVSKDSFIVNKGLEDAIASGALKPVKVLGDSGIYAVTVP